MSMLGKNLILTTVVPRDVAVVSAEDRVRVLCRKLSGNICNIKSHAWPCGYDGTLHRREFTTGSN